MIGRPLTFWEADQEAELVARPDLSRRLGNGRSTMDTIFHRVPNALKNVKEVLLETLATSAHITGGSAHGLAERL
jgi:hypothetical protein